MQITTSVAAGPDAGGTASYVPAQEFRGVVAGEAITKGNLVTFYKNASTMDGVRVYITTAATDFVCGVAQTTASSGAPLTIQTQGIGAVAITTDGSAEAIYGLLPAASGVASGVTAATVAGNVFGYALVDDADTTLAAGEYMLSCWF